MSAETAAQLIGRLERLWLDPQSADVGQLTRLLEQRQEVIIQLQNTDTSDLDPESRRSLAERIQAVRVRDERLASALAERQQEALTRLDGVTNARTAVRGYRPGDGDRSRGPDRIA